MNKHVQRTQITDLPDVDDVGIPAMFRQPVAESIPDVAWQEAIDAFTTVECLTRPVSCAYRLECSRVCC